MASLTIGSGELVFSSRAGALFGYQVLGLFVLVLTLKWALVFASATHWVNTERHPFQRWVDLPGPRGWLPLTFFLLAMISFPVWVSFHAGTIGTLLASLTNTTGALRGTGALGWAVVTLLLTMILSATGTYARQEKLQTGIVALMLVTVLVSLVLLKPDVAALLGGLLHLGPMHYPEWAATMTEFADRPVWVEVATYAGVLGGGGYDYLAYVTWLREKHRDTQARRSADPCACRELRRIILLDCSLSFVAVLIFSVVFVACGHIVLGSQHRVPGGADLLTLQAQFVGAGGAWLTPLYFAGALLAMGGTLYGTIEVAPTILREMVAAFGWQRLSADEPRVRAWAVRWCSFMGLGLLLATLAQRWFNPSAAPVRFVVLLTPANLFTGVLACGIISLLNLWVEWRFVARGERLNLPLLALNAAGATLFLGLGIKGSIDFSGWVGPAILTGTIGFGIGAASLLGRARRR